MHSGYRELPFVSVGGFYGGDQNWSPRPIVRMGGCSTIVACEMCAMLAGAFPSLHSLYPCDPVQTERAAFLAFTEIMYRYIYPRIRGLSRVSLFRDGFLRYAQSVNALVSIDTLTGHQPYAEAEAFILSSLHAGCPVAFLLLEHRDVQARPFTWHWFTITGYQWIDGSLHLIFGTFGKRHTMPLRLLWETGKKRRGGLVSIRPTHT